MIVKHPIEIEAEALVERRARGCVISPEASPEEWHAHILQNLGHPWAKQLVRQHEAA